jgi:hypothetical protein
LLFPMQAAAAEACLRQVEQYGSLPPPGFDQLGWQGVLASTALCCAAVQRWEEVLLLQELLGDCEVPAGQLPGQLQGQVLVACVQLGEWELGAAVVDSCGKTDWKAQGLVVVQEASCALHANPRQGLKGLLELAGEGHPVGAMAVRGLLASCERGAARVGNVEECRA